MRVILHVALVDEVAGDGVTEGGDRCRPNAEPESVDALARLTVIPQTQVNRVAVFVRSRHSTRVLERGAQKRAGGDRTVARDVVHVVVNAIHFDVELALDAAI